MRLVVGIPEPHVTREVLEPAAEAVTRLDEQLIERGEVPTFHKALEQGLVRWQPEAPGDERFDHARTVLQRGHGDCDDLAPWRAASARATGEDPGARAVMLRRSPTLWHCVVKRSDGSLEDPSAEAGMHKHRHGGASNAAATSIMQPAAVVGGVKRPAIALRPVRFRNAIIGWQARVDMPMTTTEQALVQLHYAPVASQAIIGAANAGGELAEASGTIIDPNTIAPVDAIAGLLAGYDPHDVAKVCGTEAVERAVRWLDHAEHEIGWLHHEVGLFGIKIPFIDHAIHAISNFGPVKAISHAVESVSHVLRPFIDLGKQALTAVQGVISLVPGIGTGISAAISAGLAVLGGGSPLEIAVKTAYGAIPIPPGLRNVTDTVLDAALNLARTGNLGDAAIATARSKIPGGIPQDIFDTLVHLIIHKSHGGPTRAVATPKPGTPPGAGVHLVRVPVLHVAPHKGGPIVRIPVRPPTPPHPNLIHLVRPLTRPTTTTRPYFMSGLPPHARFVGPAGLVTLA